MHFEFSGLQIMWTRFDVYDQSIYILVFASQPEAPAADRSYILEKKNTVFLIGLSIYIPN